MGGWAEVLLKFSRMAFCSIFAGSHEALRSSLEAVGLSSARRLGAYADTQAGYKQLFDSLALDADFADPSYDLVQVGKRKQALGIRRDASVSYADIFVAASNRKRPAPPAVPSP